jgi:hypothetical protein
MLACLIQRTRRGKRRMVRRGRVARTIVSVRDVPDAMATMTASPVPAWVNSDELNQHSLGRAAIKIIAI